jgi:hypothetical protein
VAPQWLCHMLRWANKQLAVLFVPFKVVRYCGNPFDSDALVLTPRLTIWYYLVTDIISETLVVWPIIFIWGFVLFAVPQCRDHTSNFLKFTGRGRLGTLTCRAKRRRKMRSKTHVRQNSINSQVCPR